MATPAQPQPHTIPALDPSKPTQAEVARQRSYGGQSLFVPVNVWGTAALYLAVGCMPREDYTVAPLPAMPAGYVPDAPTTTLSQQYDVQMKFHEKTAMESKMYPYRYCAVLRDDQIRPKLMVDNPQIGLTPDRAQAVVRNMRRTLFSNSLRDITHLESANLEKPRYEVPAAPTAAPSPAPAATAAASAAPTAKPASPALVLVRGCYSSVIVHIGAFDDTAAATAPAAATASATATAAAAPAVAVPAGPGMVPVDLPALSGLTRWLHARIPWGFFQNDSKLIGSERWTVQRCARATPIVYRVNYFRSADGNTFHAKVVPTSLSGLYDLCKLKLSGTL